MLAACEGDAGGGAGSLGGEGAARLEAEREEVLAASRRRH